MTICFSISAIKEEGEEGSPLTSVLSASDSLPLVNSQSNEMLSLRESS